MRNRVIQISLILCVIFFSTWVTAGSKIAVKLNTQAGEGDFVGQRLIAYIQKGIEKSSVLKTAGEDDSMLIVNMITKKVRNRPRSAYSYIVTFNAFGKVSPVLAHRLGICGNTRVQNAALSIVSDLEELAERARSQTSNSSR